LFTKRITALLGASGLAAAGFAAVAAAPAASAGTGTTIATKFAAGYQASGRDFRFITSTITVPDDDFSSLYGGLYPEEYIQLSNGSLNEAGTPTGNQYVRAGVETCAVAHALTGYNCPSTQTWVAYAETFDNSLITPFWAHYVNIANINQGDGVNFSIYYNVPGNELDFTITPPKTSGAEQFYKTQARGAIFDHAAALNDFTNSSGGVPIALPPIVPKFQVNSFLEGAITTQNGQKGSFTGPWTTSEVEATSDGLAYPLGTVRVNPTALYADGFKANGAVRSQDAFDIWAR
jgi:hypothetical protein